LSILGRLAPNDLERLSAYVDGALPAREQAGLEARLKADAELRQALAEVRSVKAALAGLPQRRLPRNFTLQQADVGRRTSRLAFPYLRFASIVASALFVLTTAVRSLSLPILPMASAPAPQFAAEVQGELEAAVAGTPEAVGELRAEAPAASTAEEGLSDSLAAVSTATPAGTDCPACPTSLTTAKAEMGQVVDEVAGQPGQRTDAATPLLAAQWLFGLGAIVLGVLAVRARRP
jgi:anti-sigma factor RsiW